MAITTFAAVSRSHSTRLSTTSAPTPPSSTNASAASCVIPAPGRPGQAGSSRSSQFGSGCRASCSQPHRSMPASSTTSSDKTRLDTGLRAPSNSAVPASTQASAALACMLMDDCTRPLSGPTPVPHVSSIASPSTTTTQAAVRENRAKPRTTASLKRMFSIAKEAASARRQARTGATPRRASNNETHARPRDARRLSTLRQEPRQRGQPSGILQAKRHLAPPSHHSS